MIYDESSPMVIILSQQSYFFKLLQSCLLMAAGTTLVYVASAIYCGGGAFVRYLYVRSSLRKDIQVSANFQEYNKIRTDIYSLHFSGGLQEKPIRVSLLFCSKGKD